MVSRSGERSEGQRPLTPSRTPGTPIKPRLARVGTSPSKRDEKPKEEKILKSSAQDVAELKDYVCTKSCQICAREDWLTFEFLVTAIGRLPGERGFRVCLSGTELEYRGDCCGQAN